jgi:SAM-dependent methyltransferase
MIRDDQIPELVSYREYESKILLEQAGNLSESVVFRSNDVAPVHGWFRFKEGFSADLLLQLLTKFDYPRNRELRILDPFCGVGTTLLSAQLLDAFVINAVGIERNPFIGFVAQAKLNWSQLRPNTFLAEAADALESATQSSELPVLSSIREGRCISRYMAGRLLGIHNALKSRTANYQFLRLGIAAAIEPLSRIRRDGRALRIVSKPYQRADQVLDAIWHRMHQDAVVLKSRRQKGLNQSTVFVGDGRNPTESGIERSSIDLLVTSPPYPNNIDYSEVYKLELWLLGFVKSAPDFLALRRSTFRSHPTYGRSSHASPQFMHEVHSGKLRETLGKLLERIERTEFEWRARLLEAYFSDCWDALVNYNKILRPGGRAVFVVGNSLHGTDVPALVATDLILAKIGECLGYQVENVTVARSLKRRLSGNHFLRESLVVLRKSNAN